MSTTNQNTDTHRKEGTQEGGRQTTRKNSEGTAGAVTNEHCTVFDVRILGDEQEGGQQQGNEE